MCTSSESESVCQDIEELQQSLESLTRVLEGSQLGFWDWNLTTNEVRRNPIWAEMLGYKFDDIAFTTQQWIDFVHPDDKDRAWASIYAVLDGRKTEHELTYRMKTKQGEYKWILDRARVVQRDADGKPLRMSGTHTDVDQLKKTEDALHDSEKRFRGIFENAGVGIAQVSPKGTFQFVNDKQITTPSLMRATGQLLSLKDEFGEPVNEKARKFIVMVPVSYMKATAAALGCEIIKGTSNSIQAAATIDGYEYTFAVNARLPWITKFALFRADSNDGAFIRQDEEDIVMQALAEGSELEFNNKVHRYGIRCSRNVGYGFWQRAVLVTFS